MKKCDSCGRILKEEEGKGSFCKNCVEENGNLRSYDEVSDSLAKYLRDTQGLDEKASINAAKAIVSSQPVWEKKQGVYFEGDMKRKKNLVITLIVVIALILTGVGIEIFVLDKPEEEVTESKLFDDKEKNYVITHEIDGHKTYELDLPGYQTNPTVIVPTKEELKSKYDAFIFASEEDTNKNGDEVYDLCRYKIAKDGSKEYGILLDTEKLVSDTIEKNGIFVFLKTVKFDESVRSINGLFNNKKNNSDSLPFKWEPISKPYHPQFSILEEHMDEKSYFQVNEKYIIWCEFDSKTSSQSLYLRNFDTLRTIEISRTVAPYTRPLLLSNYVVWEDNRNIEEKNCSIFGYNISNSSENILFHSNESIGLYSSKNENYFIFTTYNKKDDSLSAMDYTLNVYDLKKMKVEHIIHDDFWFGSSYLNSYTYSFPAFFISDDLENPIITWGIRKDFSEESEDINSSDKDYGIAYFRIGVDKKPNYIKTEDDEFYNVYPIGNTKDYVLVNGINKLWIVKISESGLEHKIKELVEWNDHIFFPNISKIDGDFIFWLSPKIENVLSNEDDGILKSSVTGSNICWARLSEIFPEE